MIAVNSSKSPASEANPGSKHLPAGNILFGEIDRQHALFPRVLGKRRRTRQKQFDPQLLDSAPNKLAATQPWDISFLAALPGSGTE